MKHYRTFGRACLLALFTSIGLHGQQSKEIEIPEKLAFDLAKKYSEVKIYPVAFKEIEYHGLDTAQVMTEEYRYALTLLEKYKVSYDKYQNELSAIDDKRNAIKTINSNIDKFLNSDEKYDEKKKYLIEAQELADKHKIEFITTQGQTSLKGFVSGVADNNQPVERKVLLYSPSEKANRGDVKLYKEYLTTIKVYDPQKPYDYQNYVNGIEQLKSIPKTQTGMVVSDKLSKKKTFMLNGEPLTTDKLYGKYVQLPESYMLVLQNVDGLFVKDELINDIKGNKTFNKVALERYPLLQKAGTEEYYYVMSNQYVSSIQFEKERNELFDIVHRLGYTEYKDGEYHYIKSKTAELQLDLRLYDALKKNPNFISTFDADQAKSNSLIQQTKPHIQVLDKYLSTYNIQRNRTSASTINAWRTATVKAQTLANQIYKIREKYDGNYSFRLLVQPKMYDTFLDNLLASKGVLGM